MDWLGLFPWLFISRQMVPKLQHQELFTSKDKLLPLHTVHTLLILMRLKNNKLSSSIMYKSNNGNFKPKLRDNNLELNMINKPLLLRPNVLPKQPPLSILSSTLNTSSNTSIRNSNSTKLMSSKSMSLKPNNGNNSKLTSSPREIT